MNRIPVSYGTKERYRIISKDPSLIYIITNPDFNEITLYLGEIPLSRNSGVTKTIDEIYFRESDYTLYVIYNDNTFEVIDLTKEEFITSISYDYDTNILLINNSIKIDFTSLKLKTLDIIEPDSDINAFPWAGAFIDYLNGTYFDNLERVLTLIADALREKKYIPKTNSVLDIVGCINRMPFNKI